MGIVRSIASGAAGFVLGAGLMVSPNAAKWRRMAYREMDALRRNMMKRR